MQSGKKCIYIYETNGLDDAIEYIKNLRVSKNLKAGLRGEILFFEKYYELLKLEALLDAGVKADFMGIYNGKLINFDVTTNLSYKNIDDYIEIIKKKKKLYSIALVDLKSEEIDIFPLKFPICPECGKFSHYILYRYPKEEEEYEISYTSDKQFIYQYCDECAIGEKMYKFNRIFQDYYSLFEQLEVNRKNNKSDYSSEEINSIIQQNLKYEIQIYEKESGLLISALADRGYNTHAGFWAAYVYWTHPLAKNIDIEILLE